MIPWEECSVWLAHDQKTCFRLCHKFWFWENKSLKLADRNQRLKKGEKWVGYLGKVFPLEFPGLSIRIVSKSKHWKESYHCEEKAELQFLKRDFKKYRGKLFLPTNQSQNPSPPPGSSFVSLCLSKIPPWEQ